MKTFFKLAALLLLTNLSFSQDKICDFETDIATDTSSTRVLSEKIIDESIFGNTTSFLTFKLFEVDGVLGVNFQYLQKSKDILSPICIDKNTKMVLELSNGKQVKLVNSTDSETCNKLQYDAINKNNVRVLDGFFYFTPENFQDLKTEKVYLIKITAKNGDVNFVIKPTLNSEIYKEKSTPDTYFMDYLKCLGV
ncbi:hypothetical protein [Flavobacterium terrigena]|uniref:Uncharacterized protein n=1 Tax=Flavobacterium terrigena TaxID=402734 RepID=A0A1H6W1L8_9FLAO|nr:hypothetical protein [Flavobacterium terrigena]SEJ07957.1 hypothetical protein SAMN05660918_2299 [Flavobacterium terrigena]